MDAATALAIVTAIDTLRADEGSEVRILCDNPDFNGQPDRAVEVCGSWTRWHPIRFADDSLLGCLEHAVVAMQYHQRNHPND